MSLRPGESKKEIIIVTFEYDLRRKPREEIKPFQQKNWLRYYKKKQVYAYSFNLRYLFKSIASVMPINRRVEIQITTLTAKNI